MESADITQKIVMGIQSFVELQLREFMATSNSFQHGLKLSRKGDANQASLIGSFIISRTRLNAYLGMG